MSKIQTVYLVDDLIFQSKEDAVIYGILKYPTSFVFSDKMKEELVQTVYKELKFLDTLYTKYPQLDPSDISKTDEFRKKILKDSKTETITKPGEVVALLLKSGMIQEQRPGQQIGPLSEDGKHLLTTLTTSKAKREILDEMKKRIANHFEEIMTKM